MKLRQVIQGHILVTTVSTKLTGVTITSPTFVTTHM